ncbi:MAG: sugar transferase [candidate division KSB1 bacterium]|nr:sugar transferase [candidate division KSB1 bacterium]
MSKRIEKVFLILVDFLTINLAFMILVRLRSSLNLFTARDFIFAAKLSLIVYLFWLLLFLFRGLYRSWYTQSRFDELLSVFKTTSLGMVLIFVFTFEPEQDLSEAPSLGRMMILSYWVLMMTLVGGGRLVLHTIERKLLESGIGQQNTLIIGWNEEAREMVDRIKKYPALGYRVIGFVGMKKQDLGNKYNSTPVLGWLKKLPSLVNEHQVEQVILAPGKKASTQTVMRIIGKCEDLPVHIKIEPNMYDIVLGHARTNQIYGFPLIEIHPELMPPWEKRIKRLIDILFSFTGLILLSPVLILFALLIKIDSKGPVFFTQERVGRKGKIFSVYKFRSMIRDAEKYTGPVWADENDPRITRMGRFMRKTRIDEFPQLINVLKGDMSLVGPRPERPFFVEQLKKEYPFYSRRLRVKPGVTGWAQVKGKYDTTIEAVKEKLEFDLYYIDNISLRLDLRIMVYTIIVMLKFKGQ